MALTLESTGGSGVCPPEERYTLQIAGIGDQWIERPNFNDNTKMDLNADITFKIVGVPDDFEEEEQAEWIGFKFSKYYRKPGRMSDDRGALNQLIRAAMNVAKLDDDATFDASELVGKKFLADIEPTPSGYPKITKHSPVRRRPSSRTVAKQEEPEEDEEFPE